MRIALGQHPHQRSDIVDAGQSQRAPHQSARPERERLDGVRAQMLVEPGAPDEADRIAELERRAQPSRPPAAHEAEMTPVRTRQRFDNRGRLAVPADPNDEPLVAPFHGKPPPLKKREDAPAGARGRASRR
jgi:hypothetical protein